MPPIAAEPTICTIFQRKSAIYQLTCLQYPLSCSKFLRMSFLLEYTAMQPKWAARAAGLAVRRHLLQKRPQQFGRLMRA